MLRIDECDVGGQTLRLQAIPARMTCEDVLEWVGEEVLKEYRNLHHTRGLKAVDRDVNYVGEGSGGESAIDPAGTEGGEALDDDDHDDEHAETAVCAFVAKNLNAGSNQGGWKPLQKGWEKKKKKEPRRMRTLCCPVGSSYELTLRAVSCVMGGTKGSTMTTGHVPSTRPIRRPTRRGTGRRSVHPRVSGRPRWRSPTTSSPS